VVGFDRRRAFHDLAALREIDGMPRRELGARGAWDARKSPSLRKTRDAESLPETSPKRKLTPRTPPPTDAK
jgi:hypothetical protein